MKLRVKREDTREAIAQDHSFVVKVSFRNNNDLFELTIVHLGVNWYEVLYQLTLHRSNG